jgi:hypothetical protein
MVFYNAFAYNTGGQISGTDQIGNLAIGTNSAIDYSSNFGGVKWWQGPNYNQGIVIAMPDSTFTQPTELKLTLGGTYNGHDIQLSNNNQTAHQSFGYQQTVLADTIINPTDKVMFSVLVNLIAPSTLPGSHFIGIGTSSMNYSSLPPYGAFPGNDNHSMGYCSDGTIWYNGGQYLSGLSTWTDGDVIDIAVNLTNNTMWVRVNSGFWDNDDSHDPSSNIGGFEIINGPFYPALCPGYEGTMIIQNTATYGLPSGFEFINKPTAGVKFKKSKALTEQSFVDLVNTVFTQSFTNGYDAATWVNNQGYWTSYFMWC